MKIAKNIYHVLRKGSDVLAKINRVLSATLVFACFLSVLLQVLNRYIMVKQTLIPWTSISWTDEMSRFLLIGISYITLGVCYRNGQMARADMVYTRLKPIPKMILYIFETALIMIFVVSAAKYGIQFAAANHIYKSDMMRIPGNYLYSITVVGMILVGYEVVTEFFGVISGELKPFESIVPPESVSAE